MVNEVKTLHIANALLLPEVIKLLNEGHTVTLPLRGYSMRPFLENGRDKALLRKAEEVKVGDPVLAEIHPGHYVLHRIVDITGDQVTLRGDGNLGTEQCQLSDVKAIAIGFYRKGREKLDSIKDCKWHIYSWWWVRLLPLRRYLLFAFHPHIPRRWRKLS